MRSHNKISLIWIKGERRIMIMKWIIILQITLPEMFLEFRKEAEDPREKLEHLKENGIFNNA